MIDGFFQEGESKPFQLRSFYTEAVIADPEYRKAVLHIACYMDIVIGTVAVETVHDIVFNHDKEGMLDNGFREQCVFHLKMITEEVLIFDIT